MFTHCPNCDTHFEITQEHLNIAHGKVRCGKCDTIFNASKHLYDSEESIQEKILSNASSNTSTPSRSNEKKSNIPNIKEKMENIAASLSAATEELKLARKTSIKNNKKTLDKTQKQTSTEKTKQVSQNIPSSQQEEVDILDDSQNDIEILDDKQDDIEILDDKQNDVDIIDDIQTDSKEESSEDEFDIIDDFDNEKDGNDNDDYDDDYDDDENSYEDEDIYEDEDEDIVYEYEDEEEEPSRPLIEANTKRSRADSGDKELLQSIIEETQPQPEEMSEADAKLFDDFDNITKSLPDPNESLDNQFSSLDDDFNKLDNGHDLLTELDQIESNFRNSEKRASQKTSTHTSSSDSTAVTQDNVNLGKNKKKEDSVAPSFLSEEYRPKNHSSALLLWLAGTVTLSLLLIIQYLHFNSSDFSQNRQIRAVVEPLCQLTGCSLPLIKVPKKIVTVTHDVRTYPKLNNVLEIQLTFKNKASYIQSYPILEVIFLTTEGNVVARRNFLAAEYMKSNEEYTQGLTSNQSQDIKLKIIDPDPTSLLSFQFNYL